LDRRRVMGKNDSYYRGTRNHNYPGEDRYDDYDDFYGYGYGYGYGYRHRGHEIDLHKAVDPLVRQMKRYDEHRQDLEKQGGRIKDLATLADILSQEISLDGYYGQTKASLTNPSAARSALYDMDFGLHLQVRELRSGMPCYYLCRIKDNYLSNYSLVVEDLYSSPGYPMPDKRFVRLMTGGKERYFLRLSPFREPIKKGIQDDGKQSQSLERETDRILYNLGRYVLSPAWHEDQFPGMQAAFHFGLTQFPRVIELLYLDLSGELCELRSQIDKDILDFFKATNPQPAIRDFLKKLKDLNGAELNELPKEGLRNYVNLKKAFPLFLRTEILWGNRKQKKPLNILLLGNFSRLDLVGKALNSSEEAVPAKKKLEKESQKIIRMITKKKRDREEV